jgi:transposase
MAAMMNSHTPAWPADSQLDQLAGQFEHWRRNRSHPSQRIPHALFVAIPAVDFRPGIDGLAAGGRQVLCEHPRRGAVFVFRNRSATAWKLLFYDGPG